MKVGIAQINTRVGKANYNQDKIVQVVKDLGKQSDIIVFPEMTTAGYPLHDMAEDIEFVREQKQTIYKVRDLVLKMNRNLKVILGFVDYNEALQNPGGGIQKFNAGAVIGEDIKIYHKQLLPNYDVFNEMRHFSPGTQNLLFRIAKETKGALTICEDIWDPNYGIKPINSITRPCLGINEVFNISSSPFYIGKEKQRFNLIKQKITGKDLGFVYLNQVGAQDELIFDGASMIIDRHGKLVYFGKMFKEDITVVDTINGTKEHLLELLSENNNKYPHVLKAIELGLRDYLEKTGIKKVVLGVSGGIDSAVCAYIISKVLKAQNIRFVYMPTKHSKSLEDAQGLAKMLGVDLQVAPIDNMVQSYMQFSGDVMGQKLSGIPYENIQARIRGNILMMIANQIGGMVINTSNKTELALGYGTIYGDMIGGLSLIGDLNKIETYELAKFINKIERKNVIPINIIDKPASAELQDEQVDPFDYDKISEPLDAIIDGEELAEIAQKYGLGLEEIYKLKQRVRFNEFKRQQGAPILKLKQKSFGKGRIRPIA